MQDPDLDCLKRPILIRTKVQICRIRFDNCTYQSGRWEFFACCKGKVSSVNSAFLTERKMVFGGKGEEANILSLKG
jgi:hypothetical protein